MRRIVAALVPVAVALTVSAVVVAPASGDDGPPLTPPAVTDPIPVAIPIPRVEPPGELPKVFESTPMPRPGAVLVVPGITTPRGGIRSRPGISSSVAVTPRVDEGLPPLVGPDEMREAGPIPSSSRASSRPAEPRSPTGRPPITLESVPESTEPLNLKPGELSSEPSSPSRRGPLDFFRGAPAPPRRPGGFFGRLFAPPVVNDRPRDEESEAVKVEPRTDPAADAALKRRVETQIGESLGGKLRSFEVRVVGRDVVILARPARFWQKRGVRNALDSLPSLIGYKARIEVID